MDIFDKFFKKFAYKFDKGYPDINNEKDMKTLRSLLEEFTNENEIIQENSDVYDTTIKKALDVEEIPRSSTKYPFGGKNGSSFTIQISGEDLEVWKSLYEVSPPKKGEEEGQTKGVGNGEIALYWLYNYSESGVKVTEGREGDDPDLYFNGVGVEVKAYGKPIIGLGRFASDKDNLSLLNIIFGINALSNILGNEKTSKVINPTNFKGSDLVPALEQVLELGSIEDLSSLASKYSIFKTIKDNIDIVNTQLNNPNTATEAAIEMSFKLLDSKLGRKPGEGGYLADVTKNGKCIFYSIDLDKLRTSEDLLNNFGSKQSSLYLNFEKLFK